MNNGYARDLLKERGHRFLPTKGEGQGRWPNLELCVQLKLLPYIDLALAESLLKRNEEASEAVAALLCHLSLCARQGHLCASIGNGDITPDPRQLWQDPDVERNDTANQGVADILPLVHRLILQGVEEVGGIESICRHRDLYYLQKLWVYEELFLRKLADFIGDKPSQGMDSEFIAAEIKRMVAGGQLLPIQADAVAAVCTNRLVLLTGGPGTGKTYTAGQMIRLVWQGLDNDAKGSFEVALAAPTGKAAANLQASLAKSTHGIEGFPPVKATTIHSLLGINSFKRKIKSDEKLSADLILVDEGSMVDVYLMASLFASIKPGARLILLGDQHQLPSVDAGGLFFDLVEFFEENKLPSLIKLETCMRAESADLVGFAAAVKAGKAAEAASYLDGAAGSGAISRQRFDPKAFYAQLLDYSKHHFPKDPEADPAALIKEFNRFRILTPLRQGPFGTDELNRFFDNSLNGRVVPIMLLQNDYRLDLYNGETGVLIRSPRGDYAVFPARSSGQPCRRFAAALLPKYEAAYCISVHKSQGSEFDHVLMLVPKGSEAFGREVFYTAATRARQRLEVWGEDAVIAKTLENQSRRLSGIRQKLSFPASNMVSAAPAEHFP